MVVQESVIPTENDVVCGRGRGYDMLKGNRAFRRLIKEHAISYSNSISTSRKRKALIVKMIREQLSNENVKFLKQNRDWMTWHEMSDKDINVKIGHALRDAKEAVLTCNPSPNVESSSKVVNPCTAADNLTAFRGDHDSVAKQQQDSDHAGLLIPHDKDQITIVSRGSSDVQFPGTCQNRAEKPLKSEQLDTIEEMILIELLLKSPSPTQQQLPAEVPIWPDTVVPSEICSDEDDFLSRMLTAELDNITRDEDDFLKSMWDDEDILEDF